VPSRLVARIVRAAALQDRLFVPRWDVDPAAPTLVLSPHLDDAVLSCWSIVAGDAPREVVTAFTGVPAHRGRSRWDAIAGAPDAATLMRARVIEDREVLGSVGVRAHHLGMLEHPQRELRPEPSLRRLHEAVRAAVPRASRVLAPLALGTEHPDHVLLRRYALRLARGGMRVELYADVPYATVYGWPHWVTGAAPVPHLDVDAYWAESLAAVPSRGPAKVVVLDAQQAASKLAAMRRYATQFATLDRGPIGQLSNPAVHTYEVRWSVA
jgi:LmbE family N-acetylglucosaminyl deacetylase